MILPEYLQNIPAPDATAMPYASAVPQIETSYSESCGFRCRANITDWTYGPWKCGEEIVWIVFEHCKSLDHAFNLGKAWVDHAMLMYVGGGTVSTFNVVIDMRNGEDVTVSTPNPNGFFLGTQVPKTVYYWLGKPI